MASEPDREALRARCARPLEMRVPLRPGVRAHVAHATTLTVVADGSCIDLRPDLLAALDLLDRVEALTERWAAQAAPDAMHDDGGFGLGYVAGLEAATDDVLEALGVTDGE